MASNNLPKPDYATSNMRLVGYCDQGGRTDGVQIMVRNGYAYIGHIFSKGFTVVDVRDPKKPKAVKYVAAPPNTWTLHLQAFDDLLLVIHGGHEPLDFTLPDVGTGHGEWELLIDTAKDGARESSSPAQISKLEGRSLKLFRRSS